MEQGRRRVYWDFVMIAESSETQEDGEAGSERVKGLKDACWLAVFVQSTKHAHFSS